MPLNVWLYLREFPPTGKEIRGGMAKAVHGLASGLVRHGAQVTILCENQDDGEVEAPAGYRIRSFANRARRFPTLQLAPSLKRFLRGAPPRTVVVLNGIFHPSLYCLSRQLIKCDIPYVIAPHDPYHPAIFQTRSLLKNIYFRLCERPLLMQSQCVQLLDLRHVEYLRELGISNNVTEVPNGFEAEDVLPESALTWRTDGPAKLYYLGRLDAHNKGLDMLLDAYGMLRGGQDTQLTLQGPDWGDEAALCARAKAMIRDRAETTGGRCVQILGPDFTQSSSQLVLEHDVFCMPSRFEGFGLAALEAMMAGRVLLISEVAGLAPHVQKSGCGVVVGADKASITSGLQQLLNCRDRWEQMGRAGREYAMEHLRWDRIGADALVQYEALVEPEARVSVAEGAGENEGSRLELTAAR